MPGNQPMNRLRGSSIVLVLGLALAAPAWAQTFQYHPEIDAYRSLNDDFRLNFQVKENRENGGPVQTELGPSLDFYLKPLDKLVESMAADLDQSKSRPLMLSVGYRYLPTPGEPSENRILLEATPRLPLAWGLVAADRNRFELRFIAGDFFWRYRNQISVERKARVHSYAFIPYAQVEFYYSSQYDKWCSTAVNAGSQFPIGKHVGLDFYYEHQNNTNHNPNQQINAFGSILNLFF